MAQGIRQGMSFAPFDKTQGNEEGNEGAAWNTRTHNELGKSFNIVEIIYSVMHRHLGVQCPLSVMIRHIWGVEQEIYGQSKAMLFI